MNYYEARQVQTGKRAGKWHYTKMNDNQVWPVGLCADNCPGHATAEEANEHYRQYLIGRLQIKGPKTQQWPKTKCESDGCENESTHLATIPGQMFDHEFCETHATKDEAAKFVSIGERISSY